MEVKKSVAILVIIALALAFTAIALKVSDSSEVSTTRDSSQDQPNQGQVGVAIIPGEVEDKLTEEVPQQ